MSTIYAVALPALLIATLFTVVAFTAPLNELHLMDWQFEVENAEQRFNKLDTDQDNLLSFEELKAAFVAQKFDVKNVARSPTLRDKFFSMDSDGDGLVSLEEFKNVSLEKENLREAARVFIELLDDNNDGALSYWEFAKYIQANVINVSEQKMQQAFNAMDINENGQIGEDEVVRKFWHLASESSSTEYPTTTTTITPSPEYPQNRGLLPIPTPITPRWSASAVLDRMKSVHKSFNAIDRDGNGNIDVGEYFEMILTFEATQIEGMPI